MVPFRMILLGSLLLAGCSSTRLPEPPITVDGRVTVQGNVPFTALVLETDQHNSYVLQFEEGAGATVQQQAPGRFRVTGHVYRAEWNGQPFAHLRVIEVASAE